ncbi:chloramphenicol acetyltransferase [Segetibacter sp. 3557_3]|uniref:chloramphenicol acetyltransferase n=1 Tax=Segetibacter sp. 3557_3 TaxID=2547429 RepID=UPI001058A8F2|nr:chloramphenicol acetyltransferase [Segetibacter sp. 3557_3]TDH27037.1 chloramphenicol acetyltransferase [Segetibacter sp. 3557_3]
MKHFLDLEKWSRKEHFNFFSKFEEPFFGLTSSIDCTEAYDQSKLLGHSFFLSYLHKTLTAVNSIESFRYRIVDNSVAVYDQVNASPTINRPDGTFGFSYIDYHSDFTEFAHHALLEIDRVRNSQGLVPAVSGENVIHFSSIPWVSFTAISHARAFSFKDSIPKVSFGKMVDVNGRKTMPVSVHVHHALMDGFHVGQFLDLLQDLMQMR